MFSSLLINTKLKELCSNYPSTMFLTNAKKRWVLTSVLSEKLLSPRLCPRPVERFLVSHPIKSLTRLIKYVEICLILIRIYSVDHLAVPPSSKHQITWVSVKIFIVDGSTEIFWLLADSFDWHSWVKFGDRSYILKRNDRSHQNSL